MTRSHVHGDLPEEQTRLRAQAATLADVLHAGTAYPARAQVPEAGCGVGAQTIALARRSPGARITAIDVSAASLAEARRNAAAADVTIVEFWQADLYDLPFAAESFDDVFFCFEFERLPAPVAALHMRRKVLKPDGTITVIEGDHGTTIMHPEHPATRKAIRCLVDLQRGAGGYALIGRELSPLLVAAGFSDVTVEPRIAYSDVSRPA